jgi:3'(2'), 5'-bisphosphate nucleotidase
MKVSSAQLQTMCNVAVAAGSAVMAVYAKDFSSWEKADASPLTEADLHADAVIREGLQAEFPGVYILSEESVTGHSEPGASFFLVDPLDGTKEFLKRNGEFTVNIAWVYQGVAIAGVVLAPALGELFYAAVGLGAWKRDGKGTRQLQTRAFVGDSPLKVIGSRSHGGDALAEWLATLPHAHSFVAAGSSLKFCRISEGEADIYPRFGPTSQWDTAAAQAVLEVAGGAVTDMGGTPLKYGLDCPILNSQFVATGDARLLSLV